MELSCALITLMGTALGRERAGGWGGGRKGEEEGGERGVSFGTGV